MSGPDERFERALGGSPLPAEDELAAFVEEVRQAFPARPMLAEQAHLAAIADAARRLSPEARPDHRKEPRMSLPDVKFPRIRSRVAAVVAGLVVAMMSFGGLAFAGVLPNGVQSRLADVAATIGVELPDGDDGTEALEVDDDELEVEAPEASETESLTAEDDEDQGDDREKQADNEGDDDQGEDRDEDNESAQHESGDHEADDSDQDESDDQSGGDRESSSDDENEHESSSNDGGGDEQESEDAGGEHESGDD